MRSELKKLQRELGITFIHVTHGQDEALALADEVVVMNNAVIEQAGSARDVFNAPTTEFVARFLGGHNVIRLDGKAYAIRSDRVRMVAPDVDGIDTNVISVEFLGTHVAVSLATADDNSITAMVPEETFYAAPLEPGGTFRAGWARGDLHPLSA